MYRIIFATYIISYFLIYFITYNDKKIWGLQAKFPEVLMKRLLSLVITGFILLINTGIVFAGQPQIDAGAYILIDSKTGDILCDKNSQTQTYPASTTKIMTAILALERGNLEQQMTASQSAIDDIGPDGSNIGIMAGETIKLSNLLQALLISSANETANIIADNLCPTRQEFVDLMNQKAKELGATNTHFVNPCGAHDPLHYTTAADMAKIARYAMTLPVFRQIVKTPSYHMPKTNKHEYTDWPELSNTNKLMITDKNDLYVINGVKTGYTGPAGFNLVSSAIDSNGLELIAVVMSVKNEGAQENVRTYSKQLLDYGFNNFKRVSIIEKGAIYRNVKVDSAIDTSGLDLITSGSLICTLSKDATLRDIKEIPHINDTISAPVNKGDKMGYVEYFRGDVSIGRIELTAAREIAHKPAPVTVQMRIAQAFGTTYARIALYAAGFLVFFVLLRKTLRHISRRVRSGRY
jgi:D-alanyl-D-alanine carboxypeptidase (penicillin-binding protein 5/6)